MSGSLMYPWLQIPTATVPVIQNPSIHRRRIKIMFKLRGKQNTFYTNFHSFYYTGFIFCLVVCFGFFVPLEDFSLIWRRHYCWWRAAKFDLYSALMATKQWAFFSLPHLLRHGAYIYNGHLRRPVTLTGYKISSFPNLLGIRR